MLKFVRLVVLFSLALPGLAFSAMVSSLYEVDVPVATQSQADWQSAIKEAYAQVLIKISGNPNVMQIPLIQKNRNMAGSMVQSYRYNQDNAELNGANKLALHVQFDSNAIDQILAKADQPLLGRNRPMTLIWVVLQNDVGQSSWLTDDGNNNLFNYFQTTASRKGLPLVWPVQGDDLAQLAADDVIKNNLAAIQKASQSYQADSVLTGYVRPLSSQQWQGNWVLFKDGQTIRWQNQGDSTQQVMTLTLEELNHRSVVKVDKSDVFATVKTKIQLIVTGVNGLDDYASINHYLQSLRTASGVSADQLAGDKVTFSLSVNGDANAFFQELSRQGKLIADDAGADATQNYGIFYFHWVGKNVANTQRSLQPSLVSAPSLPAPEEKPVSLNSVQQPDDDPEVRF